MIEEKNKIQTQQNLIMENRQRLNISGVEDVINFDEQTVCVNTNLGMITIKGYNDDSVFKFREFCTFNTFLISNNAINITT